MQAIRVGVRATDSATLADIKRELEALRGQEPPGVELIDDPSLQPKVLDPFLATLVIAFVSGAGSKLGEMTITWLVERIRRIAGRRQADVSLTVGGVERTVNDQTDPGALAAEFVQGMKP